MEDWQKALEDGLILGDDEAPVKIVEFVDLECPFCQRFHSAVAQVKERYGDSVALVFVHYPLPMHRFAIPAAVAAECAARDNRFEAFVDVVYSSQDSLGLKTWSSFASDAGIRDTLSFTQCVAEHETFPRIDQGRALGTAMGVRGTPTVLINGWRFSIPPYNSLGELVENVLTGAEPFEKR